MKRTAWFIANVVGTQIWDWKNVCWTTDWGCHCAFCTLREANEWAVASKISEYKVVHATLTFAVLKSRRGA